MEEALRESEARYRTLIEAAEDSIHLKDLAGRYLMVNAKFASLLGFSGPEEIIGKTILDFYPEEFAALQSKHDMEVVKTGVTQETEIELTTPDGPRTYFVLKVPVKDEQGHVTSIMGIARDITGYKRIEDALTETLKERELYRTLVEEADDAIGVKDAQGRYILVNSELVRRLGIPREDLIGKTASEVYPGETGSRIEQNDKLVLRSGEPVETEDIVETTRGTMVLLTSRVPIKDDDGRPSGLLFVARDITERKRDQEALRASEERYRTLVEAADDAIYLKDLDGRYVMVNSQFQRLFGLSSREGIYGKTPLDLYPESIGTRFRTADVEVLNTGETVETETEMVTQSGPKTFLGRRVPVRDADGEVIGILGISRDITERKKAEEENRRLASAVATANEAVIIVEMDGRVSFVNPAAERMCGYGPGEMTGIHGFQLYPEPSRDTVAGEIFNATRDVGSWTGEVVFQKKTGEQIPVRLSTALMTDRGGGPTGIVGIAADISERKLLEEQLLQAQKMEAIGQLAGGVAHDFNNLLTAIIGYSQLGDLNLPSDAPLHHYFQEIETAAERASDLTRQLLAFSRRQVFEPKVVSLNEVVRNLEEMLRRLIGEHIELEVRLGQGLSTCRVDPRQIEQVLVNLAVNGRDAMPGGGRLVIETGSITLDAEYVSTHPEATRGRHVSMSVTDTGVGMTDEVQARIFEPFFTTKEVGKGTGLGLSTCHGIVAQSGGHMTVESAPYRGTTFSVYLPRVYEEIASTQPPGDPAVLSAGSETVLLVEDEPLVRDVVAQVLREQGYSVLEASNGVDAIQIARERADDEIAVLLTDVIMPVVGGVQLARQISKLHAETRVVYTSGYARDEVLQYGAIDPRAVFIPKPFTPASLTSKIREALDG